MLWHQYSAIKLIIKSIILNHLTYLLIPLPLFHQWPVLSLQLQILSQLSRASPSWSSQPVHLHWFIPPLQPLYSLISLHLRPMPPLIPLSLKLPYYNLNDWWAFNRIRHSWKYQMRLNSVILKWCCSVKAFIIVEIRTFQLFFHAVAYSYSIVSL